MAINPGRVLVRAFQISDDRGRPATLAGRPQLSAKRSDRPLRIVGEQHRFHTLWHISISGENTMISRCGLRGFFATAVFVSVNITTSGWAQSPRPLEIFFIDVDGGAATLIVTPERESILIDSGWPAHEDRDPQRIIHALKDLAGCVRLDHLITTHWHRDHFGGVAGLSKLIEIGQFWDRGLPEDPGAGADFPDGPDAADPLGAAYREASKGKRKALQAGDKLPVRGLESLVLASGGRVIGPAAARQVEGAAPGASPNPLCEKRCTRPAGRSFR